MSNQYVKKSVAIDAIQYLDRDVVITWLYCFHDKPCPVYYDIENDNFLIFTLEGEMRCNKGSWIIRGVQGEFYPCKDDIFNQTYEHVSYVEARDHKMRHAIEDAKYLLEDFRKMFSHPNFTDRYDDAGRCQHMIDRLDDIIKDKK